MRRASILAAVLCLTSLALGQNRQSGPAASSSQERSAKDQETSTVTLAQRPYRPALSLQDGLKIAERYIEIEKIDISSFWLYQAKFILLGDESKDKRDSLPCWHFWWVNDNGAMGDYVEILVTMDGRASRAPSM